MYMITRHVKEYSVSSISVHFWRKKCCLLRKVAEFACFITYKRVVKGFRQLSVKPCSVNFLTMHHHDDSVFKKLRFRATTLKFQMSPDSEAFSTVSVSENEDLRFRSLQCGREVKMYGKQYIFKCKRISVVEA